VCRKETGNLRKWPTIIEPIYKSKERYQKLLSKRGAQLSALQQLFCASNRYALPLIFQAMDAARKAGAIKHVMSGANPQGCQAFSFKHPSSTELEHDVLWRTTRDLSDRGRLGIFNRYDASRRRTRRYKLRTAGAASA
jgi:polyphosphate kinase 2 (PPK2 family)